MDTLSAFAMGMATRNNEEKVFDWVLAAKIIKERGVKNASAGLSEDWEWTCGEILREGKPVQREDTYTFLASTWATPVLEIEYEFLECYRMRRESPEWDACTYWPDEALEILRNG